jgi:hypothetical protein
MLMFPHSDMFKAAGVSIHLIASGAGAGLQQILWQVPGSSSYLSGASFPYRPEETDKTLGFSPGSYCSRDTAFHFASVAYGRAFTFGHKRPIGLGITASVATEHAHRGDHRVHACVISDSQVLMQTVVLDKSVGFDARVSDGHVADSLGLSLLCAVIDPEWDASFEDGTEYALERFYERPFFTSTGLRLPSAPDGVVLYPGSYNPPHPGHFGVASAVERATDLPVVFHVTADGPHKDPLKIQGLLKRARMLRGHDRLFTRGDALYIDKARRFPGSPIAIGADALMSMLDPKWGPSVLPMLYEMAQLGTRFYVADRLVGDELMTVGKAVHRSGITNADLVYQLFHRVEGVWDFSSTREREALSRA